MTRKCEPCRNWTVMSPVRFVGFPLSGTLDVLHPAAGSTRRGTMPKTSDARRTGFTSPPKPDNHIPNRTGVTPSGDFPIGFRPPVAALDARRPLVPQRTGHFSASGIELDILARFHWNSVHR